MRLVVVGVVAVAVVAVVVSTVKSIYFAINFYLNAK